MVVRIAVNTDLEGIFQCIDSAYSHYVDALGFTPAPMLADYGAIIETESYSVSVVEEDDRICGVLILHSSEEQCLLENIAVHKSAQGKGIGRTLLELAESTAREQGYEFIHLYTNELMQENITLYQRIGYEETHRMTENGFHRVYFKKRVTT